MGSHFGEGEFTHFRTYFGGDWDVHWGITGILTHGEWHVPCARAVHPPGSNMFQPLLFSHVRLFFFGAIVSRTSLNMFPEGTHVAINKGSYSRGLRTSRAPLGLKLTPRPAFATWEGLCVCSMFFCQTPLSPPTNKSCPLFSFFCPPPLSPPQRLVVHCFFVSFFGGGRGSQPNKAFAR